MAVLDAVPHLTLWGTLPMPSLVCILYTLYSILYTLYSILYTLYSILYTLYYILYTLCIVSLTHLPSLLKLCRPPINPTPYLQLEIEKLRPSTNSIPFPSYQSNYESKSFDTVSRRTAKWLQESIVRSGYSWSVTRKSLQQWSSTSYPELPLPSPCPSTVRAVWKLVPIQ